MNQLSIEDQSDSNLNQYDFGESSGLRSNANQRGSRSSDLHISQPDPSSCREHDLHQRDGSHRSHAAETSLGVWFRSLFKRGTEQNDKSGPMANVFIPKHRKPVKMSRASPFCPCFSGNISDSDSDCEDPRFLMSVMLVPSHLTHRLAVVAETSHQPETDRRLSADAQVHRIIEYTHHLIPRVDKIYAASYYWGEMDRFQAEALLQGKPEGTFLLRDSAQSEYLFSVSFRRFQRTLHARIEQGRNLFSFDILDESVFSAPTVTELIHNYKDPAKCLFFEPQLSNPLPRNFVFSLQDLCRAKIASVTTYTKISHLKLPQKQKTFIRELHYSVPIRTVLTSHD